MCSPVTFPALSKEKVTGSESNREPRGKVNVESVQIANVKGKQKRFGAHQGRRRNW